MLHVTAGPHTAPCGHSQGRRFVLERELVAPAEADPGPRLPLCFCPCQSDTFKSQVPAACHNIAIMVAVATITEHTLSPRWALCGHLVYAQHLRTLRTALGAPMVPVWEGWRRVAGHKAGVSQSKGLAGACHFQRHFLRTEALC